MSLEAYREKRDFEKTPEPRGDARSESGRSYLIQKHAASRLHYDFRLEHNGVLLSWAVPKGPSLNPGEPHLAVHVEDHPVEYGSFEGTIPKNEYGGGTVLLWDRGSWEPEGDPDEGMSKGELRFTLHGEKLKGGWLLTRKGRVDEDRQEWLLIKRRDQHAVDVEGQAILAERSASVASGRTLDQITADQTGSVWHSNQPADRQTEVRPAEDFRLDPARLPGARKASSKPGFVKPELAKLMSAPPEGSGWLHEMKLDGYRAIVTIDGGRIRMFSRNEKDWTARYRSIAEELARLPVAEAILDGEVVVQLADGNSSFQALQGDLGAGRTDRLLYYAFDLLQLNGYDLTGVPIEERKGTLERLLARSALERVRYNAHVLGEGELFYEQACGFGLEGVISKKLSSSYRSGSRGGEWQKIKCLNEQEFVIGGYTPMEGRSSVLGALLIGVYENERLRYVGKVGTGFTDRMRRELAERLEAMRVESPPFAAGAWRASETARWVRPEWVAEVAFLEWTQGGEIRHPSFKGLREDRDPGSVVAESPAEPEADPNGVREEEERGGMKAKAEKADGKDGRAEGDGGRGGDVKGGRGKAETEVLGVRVTNPDRVFWPADQVTKLDLIEYYRGISDWIMPHILHRPMSMVRCPQGVAGVAPDFHEEKGGPCFFHKHAGPDFPGPFERVEIVESKGPETYITVTDPAALVALAQMGVLEIHVWGSRWPDIERPDMVVFDLDPDPEAGLSGAVEGARLLRVLLTNLGLESFVKTTGGKGLHVVVPVRPGEDWEGIKLFARRVAETVVAAEPDRYTATMSKAKRKGKTFVDYLRNGRTATAIAPFSTRAKPHATVAVPLRWEELGRLDRADGYTVQNLSRRLAQLKGDPWGAYFELQDSQEITAKMRRSLGITT